MLDDDSDTIADGSSSVDPIVLPTFGREHLHEIRRRIEFLQDRSEQFAVREQEHGVDMEELAVLREVVQGMERIAEVREKQTMAHDNGIKKQHLARYDV